MDVTTGIIYPRSGTKLRTSCRPVRYSAIAELQTDALCQHPGVGEYGDTITYVCMVVVWHDV